MRSLQGPWVPPPARTTDSALFNSTNNMRSPLLPRLSELEALLLADSGVSAAGDSSPDSRSWCSTGTSASRAQGTSRQQQESRTVRPRRRPGKAGSSQRSRRAVPSENVPSRRRPARDSASLSAGRGQVAPPTADRGQVAPPTADRGQVAPASSSDGQAPPPAGEACSGEGGDARGEAERTRTDVGHGPPAGAVGRDGQPAADPPLPAALLSACSAGGGGMQEVLEKFLWARQQASAAADLMASLRQAVERMDLDSALQMIPATTHPAPTTTTAANPPTNPPTPAPPPVPPLPTPAPTSAPAPATHSSLLATSCSLSGRPWPSAGSVAGSVSSTESGSVMPEESRSQLVGGIGSRETIPQQNSTPERRTPSLSDTALSQNPSGQPRTDSLRRQFRRQQERLRRLEQTNYVLNLAVDGQDQTIRTLTTQLEDTKEALLQEISCQPPAVPAVAGRSGGVTQTGPSLGSLGPPGEAQICVPAVAGRTGPSLASLGPPGEPQTQGVSPRPGGGQAGEGVGPAVVGDRPALVETASSPVPLPEPEQQEPEPEPEPELQQEPGPAGPAAGSVSDSGDERNRREVERLLAALDAKERELTALRTQTAGHSRESAADRAFLATPDPGGTRAEQPAPAGPATLPAVWPQRPPVWPAALAGARSTEAVGREERQADWERPVRRHSFTAPLQRADSEWRHLGATGPARDSVWRHLGVAVPAGVQRSDSEWRHLGAAGPARVQRSLLAEFDREGADPRPAPPPPQQQPAAWSDDLAPAECVRLQSAVAEGRAKIRRLEEEVFELKLARRQRHAQERLPSSTLPAPSPSPGAAAGDPFPSIVRLTEARLQEAYQLLLRERQRSKQLTVRVREAASKLEQSTAAAAELKQQLSSSVEQRQQLQQQLAAAETAAEQLQGREEKLQEELRNKEALLSRTSEHLEERIAQVSTLSRQLESARSESAQEQRRAASSHQELLARLARLEQTTAGLRQENARLVQGREEAGRLAESERQLRRRAAELQERLDQSTNTTKMLESYIHFLKTSYSSLFGSPAASLAAGDEHGTVGSGLHFSGK